MNIGILAVDSNFPNLALMKISAYHKARGDQVEWYNPLCEYDKVYAAKVFAVMIACSMICPALPSFQAAYMQLKISLSHPTITIISILTK